MGGYIYPRIPPDGGLPGYLPLARTGWATPGQDGVQSQPGQYGVPLSPPPGSEQQTSTCYTTCGMPLAFVQGGLSSFLFLSTSRIVENKKGLLPCLISLLLPLISVFLCLISLPLLFKKDQLCRQCQERKQAQCYLFSLKSLLALRALINNSITKQKEFKQGVPLFYPRGLGEYSVSQKKAVGGIPILSPGRK